MVDTTAAGGNTFFGYYLFLNEALNGADLHMRSVLASVASSLCVQVMGASDSVRCARTSRGPAHIRT